MKTQVGVSYLTFYGVDRKQIFVLIRASVQQLRSFAEYTEYMHLSSKQLRTLVETGDEENNIAPLQIAHVTAETTLFPYQHIYGPYRPDIPEDIYTTWDTMSHPFCSPVRLRLTQKMIETISLAERHSHPSMNKDGNSTPLPTKNRAREMQNLRELLLKEQMSFDIFDSKEKEHTSVLTLRQHLLLRNISAFFPLHNTREIEQLRSRCGRWSMMPWQIPTNRLAFYFGEKIALYFDFLGHYARWLGIPAVIGLPIQILILSSGNSSSFAQVACRVFVVQLLSYVLNSIPLYYMI